MQKAHLFDHLAYILAHTRQPGIAMKAFKALRDLYPNGPLFIVKPNFVEDRHSTVIKLDDIRDHHKKSSDLQPHNVNDQIYHEIDRGVAYSTIARQLHIDYRKVRKLKATWDALPDWLKEDRRRKWAALQDKRDQYLEMGRDAGNRRVLLRRTNVVE